MKLSGNHKSWLNAIAKEIREAGKPVSLDFLYRVVPNQFASATNDGHVTAAENGLPRDDYAAGWRIWIAETVTVLMKSGLVEADGEDGYTWAVGQNGTWKVKFGRGTYTLYGQAESALARDKHMLGDDGVPGYLLKGWSEVEVEVETGIAGKVKKGRNTLQVHPLAFAIPPMTAAEQEQVRADIAEHGVRMPLMLYPDAADLSARGTPKLKVLDGRHRLQFASVVGKPVRVEMFEGTEQEARELVWSLNGMRRHMTTVQRSASIVQLFGAQAKAEAKEAQIRKAKTADSVSADLPKQTEGKSEPPGWEYRAVKLAGGGASPRSVRAMGDVVEAQETMERVMNGEIPSVSKAIDAAAVELGKPKPSPLWNETARTEIGRALGHLRNVVETLDGSAEVRDTDDWRDFVDEIDALNGKIRAGLRKRGVL